MLTSSDAKFRCLWHMFIWSIMLTLVSQFYILTDHIAFYIFGGICVLILPFATSLYSTTAGRKGSGLLRVAYVMCDPVLACMAVVPVLLLNRLSPLILEIECLGENIKSWNEAVKCLGNKSSSDLEVLIRNTRVPFSKKPFLWLEKRNSLTAIQASVIIPCILAVLMGRRSRKMSYATALLSFTYWLITSIECAAIIETTLLCSYSKVHFAVTTQVTVCVACILANSYAVVTLCSYLSPMTCKGDKSAVSARFNVVYKCIVGVTGVVFVEIPQLVARFQMLASTSDWSYDDLEELTDQSNRSKHNTAAASINISVPLGATPSNQSNYTTTVINTENYISDLDPSIVYKMFPTSFYMWALKDAAMIIVIIASLVLQKFGKSIPILFRILGEGRNCAGAAFDNPDAFFVPEKRDKYIITRRGKLEDPSYRDGAPKPHSLMNQLVLQDSMEESCFFMPRRNSGSTAISFLASIKHKRSLKKESRDPTSIVSQCNNSNEINEEIVPPVISCNATSQAMTSNISISNINTDTITAVPNKSNDNSEEIMENIREESKFGTSNGTNGTGKKQRKTVKFSFSENHIFGDNPQGGKGHSQLFGRSNSATNGHPILVNSNNRSSLNQDKPHMALIESLAAPEVTPSPRCPNSEAEVTNRPEQIVLEVESVVRSK